MGVVVVIGGQASGVGKTSVIGGLIAAMPELRLTAIKITQCGHRDDAGKPCDCELGGQKFAISAETRDAIPPKQRLSGAPALSDTARYLAAGAVKALWVRTLPGHLAEAMPRIEEEIASAVNVVIESNSVLEFLSPDIYALIVSPSVADFKASARRYIDRVNAVLVAESSADGAAQPWFGELFGRTSGAQRFAVTLPQFASPDFVAYMRARLDNRSSQT